MYNFNYKKKQPNKKILWLFFLQQISIMDMMSINQ